MQKCSLEICPKAKNKMFEVLFKFIEDLLKYSFINQLARHPGGTPGEGPAGAADHRLLQAQHLHL